MYAFIMTAAYGGELRAALLKPKYGPTIDSIKDIVDSGLPWKLVNYGDTVVEVALQEEEGYDAFMADREFLPYNDFPFETVCPLTQEKAIVK